MKCTHCHNSLCVEKVPIFNHLDYEFLEQIMELAHTKEYKKNEMLYNAGDISDNLFILHTGQVKVFDIDESGKEHLINVLNPGDYVGETSLFLSSEHINFAQATKDGEICTIYKDDLLELLEKHPNIAIKILEEFARRLKVSQTQAKRIASNTADSRLGLYLIENSVIRNGKHYISLTMPRKDLANFLGMSPETISRKFKSFEQLGYINQLNNKEIVLLDIDALRNL